MLLWRRPRPRLALVVCARNEAVFLPAHLLYHHAIGVDRAYVFLDRCSDESEEIACLFPWVRVIRVDSEQATSYSYVSDLHAACMDRALELAREEGVDWLMTLDPDEFAFANNCARGNSVIARAHLGRMLERVPAEITMVRLPPRELVPTRMPEETPFWKQRFFQFEPRLEWQFLDPSNGHLEHWSSFLGHNEGKSIVRTKCDVQAYDSHRWVPFQAAQYPDRPEYVSLPSRDLGWHWHFYVTDQRHWMEKFRKLSHEPEVWMCGKSVESPKQCWKNATSCLSAEQLQGYFDRWIARSEEELRRLANRGLVTESDAIEAVLREAQLLTGDVLRLPSGTATRGQVFRPLADDDRLSPADGSVPQLRYPLSQVRELLRGFHRLERSGSTLYRWSEPAAALCLRLLPGDYRLHLHMHQLAAFWTGHLQLFINERPIPCRGRHFHKGVISQVITRADFPAADTYWLGLEFAPVDTSAWAVPDSRRLGAPLVEIAFEPLAAWSG